MKVANDLRQALHLMSNMRHLDLWNVRDIPSVLFNRRANGPPLQLTTLRLIAANLKDFQRETLIQVLQSSPHLRHLVIPFRESRIMHLDSTDAHPFARVCQSLNTLEGVNWIIREVLPGHSVKRLAWMTYSAINYDMNVSLQYSIVEIQAWDRPDAIASFLTPPLIEAYSQLEELVVFPHLAPVRLLAPHFKSLRSLVVNTGYPSISLPLDDGVVDAIASIPNLETLVILLDVHYGDSFVLQRPIAYSMARVLFASSASLQTIVLVCLDRIETHPPLTYQKSTLRLYPELELDATPQTGSIRDFAFRTLSSILSGWLTFRITDNGQFSFCSTFDDSW